MNVAIFSATGVDASRHMLDSLRATFPRGLGSVTLRVAAWWQWTTLPALVRQARRRHDSTFRYYSEPQFAAALAAFQQRMRERYVYPWAIPVRNNHLIAFGVRRA